MDQPGLQSSEEDENVIVIPIDRSFSDGDPAVWPKEERFQMPDDRSYRERIATMWLKKMGAYEEGMNYIVDSLPAGYALFDRPRGSNPDIRDRFVYGHPVGQYFSSTIQFFPHFYYLMTGGTSPCPCALCEKLEKQKTRGKPYTGVPRGRPMSKPMAKSLPLGTPRDKPTARPVGRPPKPASNPVGRPPKPASNPVGRPARPAGRPVGRPKATTRHPVVVDSEGTLDVFKLAVMELKENGKIDKRITERSSMDWRAERTRLREYFEKLDLQPSYIPRAGEIVLWTPSLDGELLWNSSNKRVEIYSLEQDRWLGMPEWRAGIVGQIPEEDIVLQDLVEPTPKEWEVNYSGFRIETFPDPHSTDKSYSLHSKYVPLKCIKPFNAFELFLQSIPRDEFHPSIENALTVMSSFSLLDKYHVKGTWPNASIYCRGIFIGAELLVVGDAVRLKPKGYSPKSHQQANVTDVMVIDEIRLELTNCVDYVKSNQLAEEYRVRIGGEIYTTSSVRAHTESNPNNPFRALSYEDVVSTFQYVNMGGYGKWYRLFSGKTAQVSQDMILGRCYEPDAMRLLYNSLSWAHDLHGVTLARSYSRQTDERIPEGKDWFWGDFRTQTLAIDSLNGEDVGHYSEARDVKMWRANLNVIDGKASAVDYREAKIPGDVGRPSTKSRSTFSEVRKISSLVSIGLGATDASNAVSSADEAGTHPGTAEETSSSSSSSDDEEEEGNHISIPIEYLRGGTEETEGGDYVPDDEDEPKSSKRPKH